MKRWVAFMSFCAILSGMVSGCTYNGIARPSVSPEPFEVAGQKVPGSAAVYLFSHLLDYKISVRPDTLGCSAWSYDVEIGDSVRKTVHRATEAAFERVSPIFSMDQSTGSYFDFIVAVNLEGANANISFDFSGRPDVLAELTLKVAVYDKTMVILDQFLVGYISRQTGKPWAWNTCKAGGDLINTSFQQCLKNISIQLADKLTKNPRLLPLVQKK